MELPDKQRHRDRFLLSDFDCIGRTAWLGDGAPVVTGGNMTILSFLEVLESTCSSLGSKAKHLSVKASGNALQAQMHTTLLSAATLKCQRNATGNCKADSKQHGGCGCASSCESKMCSNQHEWLQCQQDHAVQLQMRKPALHCHATYTRKCQAAYTLSSVQWPCY